MEEKRAQLRADSVQASAAANAADTTGFVGQWKRTYGYYAYNMIETISITNTGAAPHPYACTWNVRDELGTIKEKNYQWRAKYEHYWLIGTGVIDGQSRTLNMRRSGEDDNVLYLFYSYPDGSQSEHTAFRRR